MSLKISRILHAGYVLECEGTKIAFDPIFENPFSGNCHAFPKVRFDQEQIQKLRLDAVFISHYHDDHCSLESLNLLNRETPIYIYCLYEELLDWIRELGFTRVYPLALNVSVNIGDIEVTPRRALDAGVDSMFQVRASGLNILNVVDSWIDDDTIHELARCGPWDLVLWPFQTMRELEVISPLRAEPSSKELPPEWIEQLQMLNPKYIVPSSCQFIQEDWSWYNHAFYPISYKDFNEQMAMALPQSQVVRLNPSVSVVLDQAGLKSAAPLSWVIPVGDQNVDYDYQKNLKPPPTSEIAKRFSALTAAQTAKVHEYCRKDLLERFRSLGAPQDEYFDKSRLWKLSLYDHEGKEVTFYYVLNGDEITLADEKAGIVSWMTEVPISRLYGALEFGESMTSMYVRINDMIFAPDIEREVQTADIVEDPLLRCLFNGVFGAYQKEQLKRLKKRV